MKDNSGKFGITLLLLFLIGFVLQYFLNYMDENHHLFSRSQRMWQFFITPLLLYALMFFAFLFSTDDSTYKKSMGKVVVIFTILGFLYTFGTFFLVGLGSGNK